MVSPLRFIPLLGVCGILAAQAPCFSVRDEILAEWNRAMPALGADQIAALAPADRARYDRALARIGAPGAPDLLLPELEHPTKEIWEDLARKAKTPQERFTALFFLNRFKAPDALVPLEGLTAEDAKAWPVHLRLDSQVITARIHGAEVSDSIRPFLDAYVKSGKSDLMRFHAGRLREIESGKRDKLDAKVEATPQAVLSTLDAWNTFSWDKRKDDYLTLGRFIFESKGLSEWDDAKAPQPRCTISLGPPGSWNDVFFDRLGLALPWDAPFGVWKRSELGWKQRLLEGLPDHAPVEAAPWVTPNLKSETPRLLRAAAADALGKFDPATALKIWNGSIDDPDVLFEAALLPSLRKVDPAKANLLRAKLLVGSSSVARAAGIDDLPTAPADLDALAKRCYDDSDLESALELFSAMDRWKLSPEQQKAVLTPFLQHRDWGWRYQAWLQLKKVDPATPWPSAPAQRTMDKALLDEAVKLAERGTPVRVRVSFSGHRSVTLKLDPTVAPMNVANLVLLSKKHFFDGHRVPRVVPDFVVQMGSPYDTMDGGPGYSVRCEDSTTWYSPGSVGMALAGKDTGGCQFFITTNATPHLTGKYTRVGEVANPDHDLKILDDIELGAKIVSVRVLD